MRSARLLGIGFLAAFAFACGASSSDGQGAESAELNAQSCGGMLGLACDPGSFCDYPLEAMCGAADQMGTCRTIPTLCTREVDPVCGCNGQTYTNRCGAAAAGVAVAAEGACAGDGDAGGGGGPDAGDGSAEGAACGSRGMAPCAAGLYCNFPPSAGCGFADAPGTCAAKPEVCATVIDEVCGCDGATYSNACVAARSGVSVQSPGACAK